MQADLSLRCPLTDSLYTVVYVDKQRMSTSHCTYAHVPIWHKGLFPSLGIMSGSLAGLSPCLRLMGVNSIGSSETVQACLNLFCSHML